MSQQVLLPRPRQAETVGGGLSHGAPVTGPYRLEFKAAPGAAPAPAATPAPAPGVEDESLPTAEEAVQQHEWAGDLFEDVQQISEPTEAFAQLRGVEGEEAWLDRAEDGTLTAWVRDADGSCYRYTDPDAWAVDVDAAKMVRVASNLDDGRDETEVADEDLVEGEDLEGAGGEPVDPAAEGELAEDEAVEDPALAEDGVEVDPAAEGDVVDEGLVEDALGVEEDPAGGDVVDEAPVDPAAPVEEEDDEDGSTITVDPFAQDGEDADSEGEPEGEPEEEDEDEKKKGNPFGKGKVEGKSIAAVGGYRFVVGGAR